MLKSMLSISVQGVYPNELRALNVKSNKRYHLYVSEFGVYTKRQSASNVCVSVNFDNGRIELFV